MSFFASLKEKFQNFKTEFKRSCEEATRKEEERQKAVQQAKEKTKNTPYDNYKEAHPQIQITDMDGNLFSWSWKKPIIIYFYEQILKRADDVFQIEKGDEVGNILDEKRQQVFLHTVKQIDRKCLEITGFSFVDQKGRFFKIHSDGDGVPCISYEQNGFDTNGFFDFLKSEFAKNTVQGKNINDNLTHGEKLLLSSVPDQSQPNNKFGNPTEENVNNISTVYFPVSIDHEIQAAVQKYCEQYGEKHLAEEIGITLPTVRNWLKGKTKSIYAKNWKKLSPLIGISRELVVDPTYTLEAQIFKEEGITDKAIKLKSIPIFNESDLNSMIENESYRKYKSKYKNIVAIRECFIDERVSAPWNFHIIATVERNISGERRTLSVRKIDFNNYRDLFLTGFCFLHETERTFKLDSADNEHVIYNNELYEPWQFFYKVKKIIQNAKEQSVSENITSK